MSDEKLNGSRTEAGKVDKNQFDISRIVRFMKEKKSLWLILAALILGVVLILYGSFTENAKTVSGTATAGSASTVDYERTLESRVKTLCEQVAGVSNVSVMLTLESLGEQVFAQNVDSSESESAKDIRSEYVQSGASGSNQLVQTKELTPRVKGIAVVCTGGADANIQLTLTKLLTSLFGIPSSAVSVVGGK